MSGILTRGMTEKFIDAPPAGAAGWRRLWEENARYRPRRSALEPLVAFVRRLVRGATAADADRQKDFNLVILDLLGDVRNEIEQLRAAMRGDIDSVLRDVRAADDALAGEVSATRAMMPVVSRRNDALVAALDQKIETVAARLRDVTNPLVGVAQQSVRAEDLVYRRLEDGLRGSEAELRDALAPYLAYAREHQPLFDAGCGRGELLAGCRDAGIAASGCDTNERSVADLRVRGIDAALAGIPDCFDGITDASLGSIAAIHVVEHLPVEALFALFRAASRALRPGGLLMIETPNAESIFVSASQFWRDPTHLAPRHPAALVLLGREHGFDVIEAQAVHDFPEGTALAIAPDDPPELQRVVVAINERLFAPQDFRLVLRKSGPVASS